MVRGQRMVRDFWMVGSQWMVRLVRYIRLQFAVWILRGLRLVWLVRSLRLVRLVGG